MNAVVQNIGPLLHGLRVTVEGTALALLLSTGLGFVVAGARLLGRVGARFAAAYVELFQNIPYLLLVFLMYYGLPELGIVLPALPAAILGLGLYSSAYIAEALRSGVLAIEPGQLDAAYASGMSRVQVIRSVVLNQALVYALPAVTNQWSRIVKNSSVLALVGGEDLLFEAQNLSDITFQIFAFYGVVGVLYWMLSIPITSGSRLVEYLIPWRRAQTGHAVSIWERGTVVAGEAGMLEA